MLLVDCKWSTFGPWASCNKYSARQIRRRSKIEHVECRGNDCLGLPFDERPCAGYFDAFI